MRRTAFAEGKGQRVQKYGRGIYGKGSAIRDTLDSTLYLAGYTAYPSWTSVNSTALIKAAEAGLGLTVLPDLLVGNELREERLLTVQAEGLELKNELLVIRHREKHMTAPLRSLLELITLR